MKVDVVFEKGKICWLVEALSITVTAFNSGGSRILRIWGLTIYIFYKIARKNPCNWEKSFSNGGSFCTERKKFFPLFLVGVQCEHYSGWIHLEVMSLSLSRFWAHVCLSPPMFIFFWVKTTVLFLFFFLGGGALQIIFWKSDIFFRRIPQWLPLGLPRNCRLAIPLGQWLFSECKLTFCTWRLDSEEQSSPK